MAEGARRTADEQLEIFPARRARSAPDLLPALARSARADAATGTASISAPQPLAAAETIDVGRQTVRNIHHRGDVATRRRESALRRCAAADGETRRALLRASVSRSARSLRVSSRPARAAPSAAGHREYVAGPAARSRLRIGSPHFADDGDGDRQRAGARQIAADDRELARRRRTRQAAIELQDLLRRVPSLREDPSATVASTGRAPIAARSLTFAAIARQPASSSDIASRVKSTPSTSMSVEIALRCERDGCQSAASSPPSTALAARARLGRYPSLMARIAATTSSSVTREARGCGAARSPDPPRRRSPTPSPARPRRPRPARARSRRQRRRRPRSDRRDFAGRSARAPHEPFRSCARMNFCPEKPGLTLITSTVSQSSITSSSIATGVCGHIARPALAPISRRCESRRCA